MLRWKTRVRGGECYRVVRVYRRRGPFLELHGHDFPELFWIRGGRVDHELNGQTFALEPGVPVWVRPGDVHRLSVRGGEGARLTNLEVDPGIWEELRERFPEECRPLDATGEDRVVSVPDPTGLSDRLETSVLDLAAGPARRFRLEHFLLELLHRIGRQLPTGNVSGVPPGWLQAAYVRAAEPSVFAGGVAAFAEVAGCSPAHLNRLTRRHYGLSAHAVIDGHRRRFAEVEVGMTRRSVQEIAFDCGFATPAQFYRRFQVWFGQTPRAYRMQRQSIG